MNHRCRLEYRLRVLEVVTAEMEEDQTAASQAQHVLEKRIKDRVALVTSWLRQAEHAALSALKATAMKVRAGTTMKVRTGSAMKVRTGTAMKVRTGSAMKVRTGTAMKVRTRSGARRRDSDRKRRRVMCTIDNYRNGSF